MFFAPSNKSAFNLEEFSAGIKTSISQASLAQPYVLGQMPLLEDSVNEDEHDTLDKTGEATFRLLLQDGKPHTEVHREDTVTLQEEIFLSTYFDETVEATPGSNELVQLIFQQTCLGLKFDVKVNPHTRRNSKSLFCYSIWGSLQHEFPFRSRRKFDNGEVTVKADPFSMQLGDNTYSAGQIHILFPSDLGWGSSFVQASKLQNRNVLVERCVRYTIVHEVSEESLHISFGDRKPFCNYWDRLVAVYSGVADYAQSGFPALVNYLNGLAMDSLPLPHDASWHSHRAQERLQ